LEYGVFCGCVIAAIIAMQIYVKRGIEGRLKQSADEIGDQYAPLNTTTNITTTLDSTQKVKSDYVQLNDLAGAPLNDVYGLPALGISSETEINETTQRSGSEAFGKFEDKLFK